MVAMATATQARRDAVTAEAKDWKLTLRVAPDAPLGFCEVHLSAGSGSRGRGRRPLDDARIYADALRRIAAHLVQYAADFEQAAVEDDDLEPPCPWDHSGKGWALEMGALAWSAKSD